MRKSTIRKVQCLAAGQLFAGLAFALMPALPAHAQSQSGQTVVPIMDQAPQWQKIPRPHRGETMAEVKKRFGKPSRVLGPVGKPPITRWLYNRFTVYFEKNLVIHTVLNRPNS